MISGAQAHGPYHLCGYSFGAVVAYEVATRLKRNGEDVRVSPLLTQEIRRSDINIFGRDEANSEDVFIESN